MVNVRVFEGDMRSPASWQEDLTRWVKYNDAEDDETPETQRHSYQPPA